MKLFSHVSTAFYVLISAVFAVMALPLIGSTLWQAAMKVAGGHGDPADGVLDAIGLIVIAVALVDMAKYFFEEEVLRDRELRSAVEARQTLTKFMVIIVIAVSLEAIVNISRASKAEMTLLVYPSLLLFGAVSIVVGLGVYQKLSQAAESHGQRQTSVAPAKATPEERDGVNA